MCGNLELCKNITAKFRESPSNYSAAHPKNALWRNISASHSRDLAGMFLHDSVDENNVQSFLVKDLDHTNYNIFLIQIFLMDSLFHLTVNML